MTVIGKTEYNEKNELLAPIIPADAVSLKEDNLATVGRGMYHRVQFVTEDRDKLHRLLRKFYEHVERIPTFSTLQILLLDRPNRGHCLAQIIYVVE